MVGWSAVRPLLSNPAIKNAINGGLTRNMSGHKNFPFQPSKFQWLKFKDLFHYYVMIGVIPCIGIAFLTNVFVGPAQLSEIPEEYVPKHWEYYQNPITRFLARYILSNPQQEYEKFLHSLYEEDEKARIRAVEVKVQDMMSKRNDYQAYYYRPVLAKYYRATKETSDYVKSLRSD